MTTTRSGRTSANTSPKQDEKAKAGMKRKAENTASAESKRGRKEPPAKQATIEETIAGDQGKDASEDAQMKDVPDDSEVAGEINDEQDEESNGTKTESEREASDDSAKETKKEDSNGTKAASDANGAIEESSQREKELPSNILEKGIIYFFARNRVGIEDAESVGDLSRTYFVLRPLPLGGKLGDGALQDLENNRLFALPKKTLPKSNKDRFMAFVEKANTSIQDLKDNFFKGDEYETKTQGTRRTEPATVVAEGVYAITRTEDRSTHLAYMTTIPTELGEVQEDLGLKSQGSFIMSVKNPERPGPASARLPQAPEYPKEIIEEFRGLAWTEVKPKYIDYPNAQILLIGEGTDNNLGKAVEQTTKDQKHDKETPQEELEKLEHEDELRVKHLEGNDSIFDDLKISKEEYSKVPTTW